MSMKKNLKYLLLLSLLSFMACNGDEKIDSGMVQQDGEVLQLNVRVGDFAINDVSSIRATDSGSTGTFENGDRIGIIVLDADNNVLPDNIPYRNVDTFGASTAITMNEKQPFTTTIKPPFTLPTFRIVRKWIT